MLSPVVKQEKFLNVVSKLHKKSTIKYGNDDLTRVSESKYRTKLSGCKERIKTTQTIMQQQKYPTSLEHMWTRIS